MDKKDIFHGMTILQSLPSQFEEKDENFIPFNGFFSQPRRKNIHTKDISRKRLYLKGRF